MEELKKAFHACAKSSGTSTIKTIAKYEGLGKLLADERVLGKNCTPQDIVYAEMALHGDQVRKNKCMRRPHTHAH